ncbi:MAG TPA: type IV pilin protein [Burkholderiaceae bacterium]|nr:type IV pilin protein [Burkholderiaceae bacterium]
MKQIRSLDERQRGFTLIELMITVAVVAILASLALPSYAAYVQRSRVPPALTALSTFQMRMEQYFQDSRSYSSGTNCGVAAPDVDGGNFTLTCSLLPAGGFVATVQGRGAMADYRYTIDNFGTRATVTHPLGAPAGNCWSIRGKTCDT